ncbi:MAG TPA: DUF1080 domain-containing protein, partial [Polyangia bacterium]
MPRLASLGFVLLLGTVNVTVVASGVSPASAASKRPPPVVGRWNLTVTAPDGSTFPTWLEISFDDKSGALGGRLCGRVGKALPLERAEWKRNELVFVTSPGGMGAPRTYRAKVRFGMLQGAAEAPGEPLWTLMGARAPKLMDRKRVAWAKPVTLVSRGLLGWRLRDSRHGACWRETAGVLESRATCTDIVSDGRYQDFKLHLEVKLAKGGATGVFLRGRYQVQVADDAGQPVSDESSGAIYGLIAPRENAAKPAGEWQTLDVTLVGRRVTVVLNGKTVVDAQEIPGPTGGALDSEEAVPGPVMLE